MGQSRRHHLPAQSAMRSACASLKAIAESFCDSSISNSPVDGIGCGIRQVGVEDAAMSSVTQPSRKSVNARRRVTMFPFFRGRIDA